MGEKPLHLILQPDPPHENERRIIPGYPHELLRHLAKDVQPKEPIRPILQRALDALAEAGPPFHRREPIYLWYSLSTVEVDAADSGVRQKQRKALLRAIAKAVGEIKSARELLEKVSPLAARDERRVRPSGLPAVLSELAWSEQELVALTKPRTPGRKQYLPVHWIWVMRQLRGAGFVNDDLVDLVVSSNRSWTRPPCANFLRVYSYVASGRLWPTPEARARLRRRFRQWEYRLKRLENRPVKKSDSRSERSKRPLPPGSRRK